MTKRQWAAARRAALARFRRLYPECVDPYIRIAFVTGWLESMYAAQAAAEKTTP